MIAVHYSSGVPSLTYYTFEVKKSKSIGTSFLVFLQETFGFWEDLEGVDNKTLTHEIMEVCTHYTQ